MTSHHLIVLLTFLTLVSHAAPPCSVTTLAGLPTISGSLDGRGTDAGFTEPAGISYDATTGDALVCDARNNKIRRVSASGLVTTIAGGGPSGNESGSLDGLGTAATFTVPYDVTIDAMSGEIFVTDCYRHTVRAIATDGAVTTLAGSGTRGYLDGLGTAAQFYYPKGIVIDPLTTDLLIADRNSNAIRRVTRSGAVSTIAGNGSRGSADGRVGATFYYPAGLDVDATGLMFVADEGNHIIRSVSPDGTVRTLAGLSGDAGAVDGAGSLARFHYPAAVTCDGTGGLWVSDTVNNLVRFIDPAGNVSTLAGNGSSGFADGVNGTESAMFNLPYGLALRPGDVNATVAYVSDGLNEVMRIVTCAAPPRAESVSPSVTPPSSTQFPPTTSPPAAPPVDDDGGGNAPNDPPTSPSPTPLTPTGLGSSVDTSVITGLSIALSLTGFAMLVFCVCAVRTMLARTALVAEFKKHPPRSQGVDTLVGGDIHTSSGGGGSGISSGSGSSSNSSTTTDGSGSTVNYNPLRISRAGVDAASTLLAPSEPPEEAVKFSTDYVPSARRGSAPPVELRAPAAVLGGGVSARPRREASEGVDGVVLKVEVSGSQRAVITRGTSGAMGGAIINSSGTAAVDGGAGAPPPRDTDSFIKVDLRDVPRDAGTDAALTLTALLSRPPGGGGGVLPLPPLPPTTPPSPAPRAPPPLRGALAGADRVSLDPPARGGGGGVGFPVGEPLLAGVGSLPLDGLSSELDVSSTLPLASALGGEAGRPSSLRLEGGLL